MRSPNIDWKAIFWETRGYLGLEDPVPREELLETAKTNGWSEPEFRQALSATDVDTARKWCRMYLQLTGLAFTLQSEEGNYNGEPAVVFVDYDAIDEETGQPCEEALELQDSLVWLEAMQFASSWEIT